MPTKRLVSFRSEYAAMLAPFISEDETRYYLQGIGVYPHHDEGVLIVATNGHVMGIIHDEFGHSNGEWICPISPAMKTAMLPNMESIQDDDGDIFQHDTRDKIPTWLSFVGDVAYLIAGDPNDLKDVQKIGAQHVSAEHLPAIDGKFPKWRRVVPNALSGEKAVPFNADYLAAFAAVGRVRKPTGLGPYLTLFTGEKHGPAIVRINELPEFLGVIMPVKVEGGAEPLPNWLPPADKPKAA